MSTTKPLDLRLPVAEDPLTIAEQDAFFAELDRWPSVTTLLAHDVQNVARMRATLLFYRSILDSIASLEVADSLLPDRLPIDGIVYLEERRCRECGCTDTRACPGGCSWVADDLCSRCAAASMAETGKEVA